MTNQQAFTLIAHISEDMPQVQAKLEPGKFKDNYHLRLFLPCAQRHISITYVEDWPSIKDAWQLLLADADELQPVVPPKEQPERIHTKPKHLVDGIPMYLFRDKTGAWRGTYYQHGASRKRYFGKIDPRPQYPLYEKEKVSV